MKLQWEMIDLFRTLKQQRTYPESGRQVPVYPDEFYLIWGRTAAVQRQIVRKRGDSVKEAPIAPEVHREIARLEQAIQEAVQA